LERAQAGDRRAEETIFNDHHDLIAKAAAARSERGLSPDDLFQEGCLGLVAAIHGFGGGDASKFEAYAERRVAEQMEAALETEARARREQAMLLAEAELFERAEVFLARELGRAAAEAELAAKLEWTPRRVAAVGELVREARRRHDQEMLEYVELEPDPDDPSNGHRHNGG
jgi:RNA polymerase sigma factor (sigma-70 family)